MCLYMYSWSCESTLPYLPFPPFLPRKTEYKTNPAKLHIIQDKMTAGTEMYVQPLTKSRLQFSFLQTKQASR